MTITDWLKILDREIMQNETQYDLDRKATKISALSFNNLDKYEYSTGIDLGIKPSTIEQAKFEYSPLGKVFTRGLEIEEEGKKEVLLKRLKNIENKIKGENKKESELIKNEKQLQVLKNESTVIDKKLKKVVLLKDKLDHIFRNFGSNFNSTGKKDWKKDEKKIDYNNLFLKINDAPIVKDIDFLKEISILYDLLIYLLDNSMRIVTSAQTQIYFFKAITVLRIIISNIKTDITDQRRTKKIKFLQNKKMFWVLQKCCLKKEES